MATLTLSLTTGGGQTFSRSANIDDTVLPSILLCYKTRFSAANNQEAFTSFAKNVFAQMSLETSQYLKETASTPQINVTDNG